MKLSGVIGCWVIGAAFTPLFADSTDSGNPNVDTAPINVVRLEEDTDVAAAEKPNKVTSKTLEVEGLVIPPSANDVAVLSDAIRDIMDQAGMQIGAVCSNGVDKLTMPYQQLGDGRTFKIEWRKALRLLLSPVGYGFTEDGDLVLFGLAEEVDVKHRMLAQERLLANRTPISFTTSDSEGGLELKNAIRDVAKKADITVTTDYMDPADLVVAANPRAAGALTASEIGKAGQNAAIQQVKVKRTTFDTNGQQIEWRIVLREILNPHDYDFIEVGGVVRIAKQAKIAQWSKEALAKKPLAAKVIRVYHADPEDVVKRVMTIKGLLKHPDASLQASSKKGDDTETVDNLNAQLQTGSGQQTGMSDSTSQVFNKLLRPRTAPAIIAYDIQENLAAIEEKIRLFDIKERQILIEGIIFQLNTNNGEGDTDGIKWSGFEEFIPLYGSLGNAANVASTFSSTLYGNGVDTTESHIPAVGETVENALIKDGYDIYSGHKNWLRTDGFDFKAVIQLIRERQNSKLLASPMIVVGDHNQAAIQVSDIDPVPQIDASALSSGANLQENMNIEWNMIRSGILMWVSPEITENGKSVRLTVHPQVVTKGDKVDLRSLGGKFLEYPVYNYELKMHEMDTRATVPSGATLMFGGLIDSEEVEVETKVRWLGDLPLIGWLFRSKTKQLVQKNLIIMIRPTILNVDDETGFEKPALKEMETVAKNTGRDLKSTPMEGPYTAKEIKNNVNDFINERFVKPFQDEEEKSESPEVETDEDNSPIPEFEAGEVQIAPETKVESGADSEEVEAAGSAASAEDASEAVYAEDAGEAVSAEVSVEDDVRGDSEHDPAVVIEDGGDAQPTVAGEEQSEIVGNSQPAIDEVEQTEAVGDVQPAGGGEGQPANDGERLVNEADLAEEELLYEAPPGE